MLFEIHAQSGSAIDNVVAIYRARESLILELAPHRRDVYLVNAAVRLDVGARREETGQFVAREQGLLQCRFARYSGEVRVREDRPADLRIYAALSQYRLAFGWRVRQLRMNLPIEVVQQRGDRPLGLVLAELPRVGRHASLDR